MVSYLRNVSISIISHVRDYRNRHCFWNIIPPNFKKTEENHCYENAMAERVNGILKDEFYLDQTFANVAQAKRAAKNAIKLYNEIRLHLSLDFKTPNMVYKLSA
jgi:hypothetical protein|tara:strand:+ start:483 stop:794 length:312 start_codon:yes stop_codon:yes gene_type:complete